MKTTIAALAAVLGLLTGALFVGQASTASVAKAADNGLPGMCNGRSDGDVVLNAHANASRPAGVPKFILNITTDAAGKPSGVLVVGQGKSRLMVTDWCRFWQHQPGAGNPDGGQCEDEGHDPDNDMVNAHAVGITWYNGEQILVRTDVRDGKEGKVFRVRYRVMGAHHDEVVTADEGGCEDDGSCEDDGGDEGGCEGGGWTRIPAEHGWAPLDQLIVRTTK